MLQKKVITMLHKTIPLLNQYFSTSNLYKNRNEDDYQILSFLGKGSSSRVYLGYDILNHQKVTIKLIKKEILLDKIIKQIQINTLLRMDNCPNIVPLKAVIKNEGCDSFGLIFEHIPGVPLNVIMKEIDQNSLQLSKKQIYKIIYQMLQTLKVIHRNKIIYRDLKPANILYSATNDESQLHNVFLFDFGLAIVDGQHKKNPKFGTKCYKPPQSVFLKNQYNQKLDIWVLGLIFAQLLSREAPLLPYKSDKISMQQIINMCGYDEQFIPQQLKQHIVKPSFSRKIQRLLENFDKQTIFIIRKMLHINPLQRPAAQDILKSKIFDQYLPL